MSDLELVNVCKTYQAVGREPVKALDNVSLTVPGGTISGLVGESGSGKTTFIRCVMGIEKPDSGSIRYDGIDLTKPTRAQQRRIHREIQLVFQDPTASLNPRMTAYQLISEGLVIHNLARTEAEKKSKVIELLEMVGLGERDLDRRPKSFSGGQRQRIAIARALAVSPKLLVCDEPVSALDVSVQAQVLNVLHDMQEELGLTILFIAHDLAVVRQICSTVAVIKTGQIVERGPSEQVLAAPEHEYTKALVAAIPIPDPVVARQRAAERVAG
ncbi:ATP-binding cassette domain-containing protein [Kribbella sp. GL6]|uniref:ATP-binding cassette domain-containing protein n=1 Tax=Kribbella sp. GL6 TaxID=3419765 RepID=UPI003D004E83